MEQVKTSQQSPTMKLTQTITPTQLRMTTTKMHMEHAPPKRPIVPRPSGVFPCPCVCVCQCIPCPCGLGTPLAMYTKDLLCILHGRLICGDGLPALLRDRWKHLPQLSHTVPCLISRCSVETEHPLLGPSAVGMLWAIRRVLPSEREQKCEAACPRIWVSGV